MASQQFDREKFKDVVHYIVARTEAHELGKVKLHKALYFADMLWFIYKGVALTGAEYRKQPMGPCASHLTWALSALETEGRIKTTKEWYFGYEKYRFTLLAPAELSRLDQDARALLDEAIDFVCRDNTARTISELSHTRAWDLVGMGKVMPYASAMHLLPTEVEEIDIEWAAERASEIAATRSKGASVQRRSFADFRASLRGD